MGAKILKIMNKPKKELRIVAKKTDVKSTLLLINVGETVRIKTRLIKPSSVRSGVSLLNMRGYSFEATERGLVDEMEVTRLK
jgi:hypothetical protein